MEIGDLGRPRARGELTHAWSTWGAGLTTAPAAGAHGAHVAYCTVVALFRKFLKVHARARAAIVQAPG
jgi:predicted metallopeptidase